ncbi:hypothetical protein SADUNF_Sadunf03G0003700 [Salix dunnii]|uniref:Uncharacterized protein n=1 Tax=Salix dunnii TaxID=1413687 RepID=A0A835N340_9ROSI|nr:hypothetical protein SADUNF_Sadunf03G0003700 [Salix dunnii]
MAEDDTHPPMSYQLHTSELENSFRSGPYLDRVSGSMHFIPDDVAGNRKGFGAGENGTRYRESGAHGTLSSAGPDISACGSSSRRVLFKNKILFCSRVKN